MEGALLLLLLLILGCKRPLHRGLLFKHGGPWCGTAMDLGVGEGLCHGCGGGGRAINAMTVGVGIEGFNGFMDGGGALPWLYGQG